MSSSPLTTKMVYTSTYDYFLRDDCDPTSPLVTDGCRMLNQQTAGLLASLFGLINLFARGIGGYTSDRLNRIFGIPGRLVVLLSTMTSRHAAVWLHLPLPSAADHPRRHDLPYPLQHLRADERGRHLRCRALRQQALHGHLTIAGIVGAGGNIGGVTCTAIFKTMATPYEAFQFIGAMIGVAAMCVLLN
jgi:NNP family nitrate/nitrite transporter-like MFS transporter